VTVAFINDDNSASKPVGLRAVAFNFALPLLVTHPAAAEVLPLSFAYPLLPYTRPASQLQIQLPAFGCAVRWSKQ
jgi:hypothetical protein